jgi:sugar phosphate isomerase/epimerase
VRGRRSTITAAMAAARRAATAYANIDPSHFFWMGMDPLAVLASIGDRAGHCHGKGGDPVTVIDWSPD